MERKKNELQRPRANSQTTIAEFCKRKREEQKSTDCEGIFKKSAATLRTPPKNSEKSEGSLPATMDLEALKSVILDANRDANKEQTAEIRVEIQKQCEKLKAEIMGEFDKRDQQYEDDKKRWEEEKKEMQEGMRKMCEQMNAMENQSRRDNIILRGIAEEQNETWERCSELVQEVGRRLQVDVRQIDVVRAHRLGKKVPGRSDPRPIIAKMNWNTKEKMMAEKGKLKGTQIYLDEDYSQQTLKERRELRQAGRRMTNAKIRYNKLIAEEGVFMWREEENRVIRIGNKNSEIQRIRHTEEGQENTQMQYQQDQGNSSTQNDRERGNSASHHTKNFC